MDVLETLSSPLRPSAVQAGNHFVLHQVWQRVKSVCVCVAHEGMGNQTNTTYFQLGKENTVYSYMLLLLHILISLKLVIKICGSFVAEDGTW